jgi:hypothetical protein
MAHPFHLRRCIIAIPSGPCRARLVGICLRSVREESSDALRGVSTEGRNDAGVEVTGGLPPTERDDLANQSRLRDESPMSTP